MSFIKNKYFQGLIGLLSLGYLIYVLDRKSTELTWPKLSLIQNLNLITPIVFLAISNWALEILRWKIINSPKADISYKQSIIQNLKGHSAGIISPMKLGEYPIKLSFFPKEKHKYIAYNIFSLNLTQLLATLIFGTIGLFYISEKELEFLYEELPFMKSILITGGVCLVIFYLAVNRNVLIQNRQLWKVILLAMTRYLCFSSAYVWGLYYIGSPLSITELYAFTSISYLLLTLVPLMSIFDLVIKTTVFVAVFSLTGTSSISVIFISFLMWFFNWGVPAILGSSLMFKKAKLNLR